MARKGEEFDARRELLHALLTKVHRDQHPSVTHMNLIEELLSPDERSIYAQVLMEKIRRDPHPSYPMIQRVLALS